MKALQHSFLQSEAYRQPKVSLVQRFVSWSRSQEKNRLGWLALIIAAHGCVATPITLIAIILSGNNIVFWFMAMAAMGGALVTNLAAMPTRITIPVFITTLFIDLFIIINCVVAGFNIAAISQ